MSKSKGDFLTVSFVEDRGYNPLAYRYLCLNSHYRNTLMFDFDILNGASREYTKLRNKTLSLKEDGEVNSDKFELYNDKFKNALSNDLNTSMCITILYELLKDDGVNNATKIKLIESFDKVLSLDLLIEDIQEIDRELQDYINEMINKRNEFKKNRDFENADRIRDELKEKGILIKDTREGTIFEII